jgi:hypothetical protein
MNADGYLRYLNLSLSTCMAAFLSNLILIEKPEMDFETLRNQLQNRRLWGYGFMVEMATGRLIKTIGAGVLREAA